jgi:hypothetical protein
MTAEFGPWKYRKWIQWAFYLACVLGLAGVIIGEYVK